MIFNKDSAIYQFGEAIKNINLASGKTGSLIDGAKRLDDMANAVKGLNTQEAILALTTNKVSKEDQKLILVKAGLATATEVETVVENGAIVSKTANLTITELLSASYTKLAASLGMTTAALTKLLGWVAVIGTAVIAFNHFYDSVSETAKKADDLANTLNAMNSDFKANKKTVSDLSKE